VSDRIPMRVIQGPSLKKMQSNTPCVSVNGDYYNEKQDAKHMKNYFSFCSATCS
jgi:hypothetical protein